MHYPPLPTDSCQANTAALVNTIAAPVSLWHKACCLVLGLTLPRPVLRARNHLKLSLHIVIAGSVYGDSDPVDVVEVSSTQLEMGGVYEVKCIGAYAMIDDGELDWKVIAINTKDPLAEKINDVEDVERCLSVLRHTPPQCPHLCAEDLLICVMCDVIRASLDLL